MYRRLIVVSIIIFAALAAFCVFGFHLITVHAEGLEGKRIVAFSKVAEKIRLDVKQKLDELIRTEQQRPYTDYQYFYTPETYNDERSAILRSPLATSISHGMAYGHFQIEPNGKLISPFYVEGQNEKLDTEKQIYVSNLYSNVADSFKDNPDAYLEIQNKVHVKTNLNENTSRPDSRVSKKTTEPAARKESASKTKQTALSDTINNYIVNPFQEEGNQTSQVMTQSRRAFVGNSALNGQINQAQMYGPNKQQRVNTHETVPVNEDEYQNTQAYNYQRQLQNTLESLFDENSELQQPEDLVQIRIEPLVPMTVEKGTPPDSLFGCQVFLLRHVHIEDKHYLQGFRLDEKELLAEVTQSARLLLREGMGVEIAKDESQNAAYAAILDFGFGQVVLNLIELQPHLITEQVSQLKNWYFTIVSTVLAATILAMISLWRNLYEQVQLARKKDDFISAVSHELRTPLTTIRMYTEMLEKNWVKSESKRTEYYGTMRQENERLSRLIENVLDFSRIQRGKKRYNFELGDINACIAEVVEMMKPCAANQNFEIITELDADIQSTSFDRDAIMQIIINLIDNALKYAALANDKIITVRTRTESKYVIIEVADHGPGIPHTQRKKIFDEFYRIAEESKRETTGTGLGLALVKKFATAHNGFVEAVPTKLNGALLRVAIAKNC